MDFHIHTHIHIVCGQSMEMIWPIFSGIILKKTAHITL